jgi:hypothetical protein
VRGKNARSVEHEHRPAQSATAGDREGDRERNSEKDRASSPRPAGQQVPAFERHERERPDEGGNEHEKYHREGLSAR